MMQKELMNLLTYLVSSAAGCISEPKIYGSMRLIDAAGKIIMIMNECGEASEPLLQIYERIERDKTLCLGHEEEFVEFLNDISAALCDVIDN